MEDFNFDFDLGNVMPEGAGAALPPSDEEEVSGLGYPFAKMLQGNSTLEGFPKGTGAGFIAIGQTVGQDSGGRKFEGYLFERLYFLPIDKLTNDQPGTARVGARGLWGYSAVDGKSDYVEGGEKKQMECKSLDGKAPLSSFLGKTMRLPMIHDKFPGGTVIIGTSTIIPAGTKNLSRDDIQVSPPDEVCERCPLGKWFTDKGTGRMKQLCSQRFGFVIYAPKQPAMTLTGDKKSPYAAAEWPGGIVILQGGSRSSQMALVSGDGKRSPAKNTDGRALVGMFSLMAKHQTGVLKRLPKTELTGDLIPMVRGFAEDSDVEPTIGKTGAELNELARRPEMQFALIEYPSFKYAQSGLPQQVGLDDSLPGMRYLVMNVTKVDVMNAPNGPDLGVSQEMVAREEAAAWMAALDEYAAADARATLMGLNFNTEKVQTKLELAAGEGWQKLTEGREDAPQLAAGNGAGEIVDAEAIDDMN